MQLSLSLEGWIERYGTDQNEALIELINFIIEASGVHAPLLDLSSVDQGAEVRACAIVCTVRRKSVARPLSPAAARLEGPAG